MPHFGPYHGTMTRPLRIEFPGALYHLTTRGNARADIFVDDIDRDGFLAVLSGVVARLGLALSRLLPDGQSLPPGGDDTGGQPVTRHAPAQRRLYATLQSPARQGGPPVPGPLRGRPGRARCPSSGARPLRGPQPGAGRNGAPRRGLAVEQPSGDDRRRPGSRLVPWRVAAAPVWRAAGGGPPWLCGLRPRRRREANPWRHLKGQSYLGGDSFAEAMAKRLEGRGDSTEIPRVQRQRRPDRWRATPAESPTRHDAMVRAYATGAYSMARIARHFGVHYSTVSRILKRGRPLDGGR